MKLAFTMQFFPGPDETVVEWDNKGRSTGCEAFVASTEYVLE